MEKDTIRLLRMNKYLFYAVEKYKLFKTLLNVLIRKFKNRFFLNFLNFISKLLISDDLKANVKASKSTSFSVRVLSDRIFISEKFLKIVHFVGSVGVFD